MTIAAMIPPREMTPTAAPRHQPYRLTSPFTPGWSARLKKNERMSIHSRLRAWFIAHSAARVSTTAPIICQIVWLSILTRSMSEDDMRFFPSFGCLPALVSAFAIVNSSVLLVGTVPRG